MNRNGNGFSRDPRLSVIITISLVVAIVLAVVVLWR
jgi:hypothetical protein